MTSSALFACIAILYGIGLLYWCWCIWQALRLVEQQPSLLDAETPSESWPKLDVIIPVKDEAAEIAVCIESVLAQDYPDFHVVVVNDRSTDGTAKVVQQLADRDGRLI